jgi:hypothetical protein
MGMTLSGMSLCGASSTTRVRRHRCDAHDALPVYDNAPNPRGEHTPRGTRGDMPGAVALAIGGQDFAQRVVEARRLKSNALARRLVELWGAPPLTRST